MASKLEVEVEMKSDGEKLWECLMDSATMFPQALPDQYESIEIVEGDGKSVGTVHLIKYRTGFSGAVSTTKEKIEFVDEANKTLSYSVVDGDVLKYYNNFKGTITIIPKSDGSLIKWSCEFDKASDDIPNPDLIKDFAVKSFQDLDAYLFGVACL